MTLNRCNWADNEEERASEANARDRGWREQRALFLFTAQKTISPLATQQASRKDAKKSLAALLPRGRRQEGQKTSCRA